MGYRRFNYRSQELGRYVDISIVYPTDRYSYKPIPIVHDPNAKLLFQPYEKDMKFKTVYLIHGGGDDDTTIYRYTNAERYAAAHNLMLVSPNITNSFGVDTSYNVKYQSFLAKELPVVIQSLFASSDAREDNFIAGYAMGGNVALGTAALNPHLFSKCFDISGGIGMTFNTDTLINELNSDHFKNNFALYNSTFGLPDNVKGSDLNLYDKVKRGLEEGIEYPEFTLMCGSKEFIKDRVTADYTTMKELGLNVKYEEYEGYDHNFDFWDMALKEIFSRM